MHYQTRIISERMQQQPIYLITATSESSPPQWTYVRIARMKEHAFRQAIACPPFEASAFGEVLASGHGITPPTHVIWEMEQLKD